MFFIRSNQKGIYYERWVHSHGCKKWFNAVRNTSTDEILLTYKIGETPPPIKKIQNTLKSPSGEPDVGSGNFAVKKPVNKIKTLFIITFFSLYYLQI